MSITALGNLIEHEVNGQRARFERFTASLLHTIAAGEHIDGKQSPKFVQILEYLYANPFKKAEKKQLKTAAEIKAYMAGRISETIEELRRDHHGSDDAGGEDRT